MTLPLGAWGVARKVEAAGPPVAGAVVRDAPVLPAAVEGAGLAHPASPRLRRHLLGRDQVGFAGRLRRAADEVARAQHEHLLEMLGPVLVLQGVDQRPAVLGG